MSTFRQDFGTTLRQIRKSKNLNQDAVAERAGLSTSYISDVERGLANPKLDTIEALAKGVDVSAKELFNFPARTVTPQDIRKRIIESLDGYSDESIEELYHKILNVVSN